jgi:hypothetical protein
MGGFEIRSEDEAGWALISATSFGLGRGRPSRAEIQSLIERVETQFEGTESWQLEYRLGLATAVFKSWYIRGDERRPWLLRAVNHLEKAWALADGCRANERWEIAAEVGFMLVREAVIRNLPRGFAHFEAALTGTQEYIPRLCGYAEGLEQFGQLAKAIEVALELKRRVEISTEWTSDRRPPAPAMIAADAYRRLAGRLKKAGDSAGATLAAQEARRLMVETIGEEAFAAWEAGRPPKGR